MSGSREHILNKIKSLVTEKSDPPIIPEFNVAADLVGTFITSIQANKGEIIDTEQLVALLESGEFKKIFSKAEEFKTYANVSLPMDPHELADLDLAIIKGQFGVAENGAIWMEEYDLEFRILPFITEHLVIVLEETALVGNMHQGYAQIGKHHSGFGLFIAGPSKTADIEQSLVIGAHGAKSLRVLLV